MSIKYSILNVCYENTDPLTPVKIKKRNIISRYSDYQHKNNFNQPQKQTKTPDQQFFINQTQKFSLYQQYKKQSLHSKMKSILKRPNDNNYSQIMVRGFVKQKVKTDLEKLRDFNDVDLNQTLHSHNKDRIMTPRRKLSLSSQKGRDSFNQRYKSVNAIGILGVRTSFLDKYKLRLSNKQEQKTLSPDLQSQKRFRRREILCSTKRNRTIEPRSIHTSFMPKSKEGARHANKFLLQLQDRIQRIQCRPWSPSRQQQFQKL